MESEYFSILQYQAVYQGKEKEVIDLIFIQASTQKFSIHKFLVVNFEYCLTHFSIESQI